MQIISPPDDCFATGSREAIAEPQNPEFQEKSLNSQTREDLNSQK